MSASEVLYREAAEAGDRAARALLVFEVLGQAMALEFAVQFAIEAASLYHEAQREAGECPMCGSLNTDPWGGLHRNESLGCCIEPPERETYPQAAAFDADLMASYQRLK